MTDDAGPVEQALLGDAEGTPGPEFGVLDPDGGSPLAVSTGPLVVAPALGSERAGRIAAHWLVGGVAVSGLDPSYLAVACTLPPGTTDDEFAAVWGGVDAAAAVLDVAVVTGHTARYDGCAFPTVGAGTAMAVGDPGDLVTSGGAKPGDRVVVTTGPGTGAVLLSGGDGQDAAIDDLSAVRDARVAAGAGSVTAMATGAVGGVDGALARLAATGEVGIELDRERVPDCGWAREACARAGIDRWRASSPGTLVATVDPDGVDGVLEALAGAGVAAGVAGTVIEGSGPVVDGERADPAGDPLWRVLETGSMRN